jgi:hypothetical protein
MTKCIFVLAAIAFTRSVVPLSNFALAATTIASNSAGDTLAFCVPSPPAGSIDQALVFCVPPPSPAAAGIA